METSRAHSTIRSLNRQEPADHSSLKKRPATAGAAATKSYLLGTHRTMKPGDTWLRLAPALARVGVTRVADVTQLDFLGVPVYQAVRPRSRNLSVSQGKGITSMAARVSAAMEAIELYHAEELVGLEEVVLSVREMRSANCLTTSELPWLTQTHRLDAASISWVQARELGTGNEAWLPRQVVELDFTLPETLQPHLFFRSSNGLASGNCFEEALVHALSEIVERHGLYLAIKGLRPRRAIDPDSVEVPYCRDLIDGFRDAGARLAIYDLSWEAGLPVISVKLALDDLPRVWGGAGCHPSAEIALSRALTEAAQSRLTFISGSRDDLSFSEYAPPAYQTFERFIEPRPEQCFHELSSVARNDVAGDVEVLLDSLSRVGQRVFAVDLTRDDIDVPVVKVFAPGLGESHDV